MREEEEIPENERFVDKSDEEEGFETPPMEEFLQENRSVDELVGEEEEFETPDMEEFLEENQTADELVQEEDSTEVQYIEDVHDGLLTMIFMFGFFAGNIAYVSPTLWLIGFLGLGLLVLHKSLSDSQ
jgi:hypothetical protein